MKIGFIGIGNMGGAIFKGFASSKDAEDVEILISDKNEEALKKANDKFPEVKMVKTNADLCAEANIVVIGIKPQFIKDVLEEIKPKYSNDKLILSMAAGVDISYIEDFFGEGAQVVRIMPNTAAMVNEAMVAVSRGKNVDDVLYDEVFRILKTVGAAEEIGENLMDCVIGVSGSSPAYTYMYIEALVKAAVQNGMEENKAKVFAAQAVIGAAKMALTSTESLEKLRENVCSAKGTTIEAVNKLLDNGFMQKTMEGFQAAVDRSIEMTKERK